MVKKKKRKIDLPPELIHKKKHSPGSAKQKHREEFFKKRTDINPNGKEDFDNALSSILKIKGDFLE